MRVVVGMLGSFPRRVMRTWALIVYNKSLALPFTVHAASLLSSPGDSGPTESVLMLPSFGLLSCALC